jgi:hypothetical protein
MRILKRINPPEKRISCNGAHSEETVQELVETSSFRAHLHGSLRMCGRDFSMRRRRWSDSVRAFQQDVREADDGRDKSKRVISRRDHHRRSRVSEPDAGVGRPVEQEPGVGSCAIQTDDLACESLGVPFDWQPELKRTLIAECLRMRHAQSRPDDRLHDDVAGRRGARRGQSGARDRVGSDFSSASDSAIFVYQPVERPHQRRLRDRSRDGEDQRDGRRRTSGTVRYAVAESDRFAVADAIGVAD